MVNRPSLILDNGDKYWVNKYGQKHREDGPAIECYNGDKYWYINGKLHRTDGPAVEWADGSGEYWKNDIEFISLEALLMDNVLE